MCPSNSPVDPATQLTTEFGDWYRNMQDTWPRHQRLDAVHHWHMDKHITKRRSCWSTEKAVVCMREGKRTSLWTSAELKPALFRANTLHPRLFLEPPTVYRRKHVVSPSLHHSYLIANKVSIRMKRQGKLNMHIISESALMLCTVPKIIKISPCLSKLQLAKAFLRHRVNTHNWASVC